MSNPVISEEIYIPARLYQNDAKLSIVEDDEAADIEGALKESLPRGIVFALILCIPFWLLLVTGIVWLF